MARASYNPVVSPEEKQEYTAYVEQCQEMLRTPPDYTEMKDMEVYENAVSLFGLGDDDIAVVSDRDFELYGAYVEKSSPQVAEASVSKEKLPVTFNYEKWIAGLG